MNTRITEVTTVATLDEKKKLRKELRLFDLVFFATAAIIGIDMLGVVSSNGPQALTWLLISAVTFFLPYGLLAAEMGSTFTQEGGVYEWCKLAGGRFYAALTTMLYWISNPLWLGGTLSVTAIVAIKTLWFGNAQMLFGGNVVVDALVSMSIALIFIWGTIWCAIISLHSGKWFTIFGTYVKLALLALFVLLALVYAFSGHANGAHSTIVDLAPTLNAGLILTVILPVLIFNWSGFELPNGAGEEMRHPRRDVPLAVIRAGIVSFVTYAVVVITILFTLSKSQLANASGFLAAFQLVVGILPGPVALVLGWLVALAIIVALASNGGAWILGADRTYAIAALDRTAPVQLGRFSGKYGTPITVNLMSGIVATIAVAAAILLTAANGGSAPTLFALVLGFTISTTTLSYLLIFPAYLILRYKYPDVRRPYTVPGGMVGAWIVTILPFLYALIASIFILIPTDATVSNSGVSRFTYELTVFVPLLIIALLAVVFYIWGHAQKRNKDVVVRVDFNEEGLIETELRETELIK